jgi:hypothetical protein
VPEAAGDQPSSRTSGNGAMIGIERANRRDGGLLRCGVDHTAPSGWPAPAAVAEAVAVTTSARTAGGPEASL